MLFIRNFQLTLTLSTLLLDKTLYPKIVNCFKKKNSYSNLQKK